MSQNTKRFKVEEVKKYLPHQSNERINAFFMSPKHTKAPPEGKTPTPKLNDSLDSNYSDGRIGSVTPLPPCKSKYSNIYSNELESIRKKLFIEEEENKKN